MRDTHGHQAYTSNGLKQQCSRQRELIAAVMLMATVSVPAGYSDESPLQANSG